MGTAAQQISPQESERAETLRRDTASKARGQENELEGNVSGLNASLGSSDDLNALTPGNNADWLESQSQAGNSNLPEGSKPMEEEALPGEKDLSKESMDERGSSSGGSEDPVDRARELQEGKAQAGAKQDFAAAMEEAENTIETAKTEASKLTSKANHFLLEFEQNALIPFDMSTFGISLIITVPARLPMAAFLAYQLRKASNGQNDGMFNLTWDSFMPPGADMSMPLPPILLKVAVVAYLLTVLFATLVLGGLLGLVIMAMSGQASALSQTFSFFKGIFGV